MWIWSRTGRSSPWSKHIYDLPNTLSVFYDFREDFLIASTGRVGAYGSHIAIHSLTNHSGLNYNINKTYFDDILPQYSCWQSHQSPHQLDTPSHFGSNNHLWDKKIKIKTNNKKLKINDNLQVWPVNPDTNFVLHLSAGVGGTTFNVESILILPSLVQRH